MTLGNSIDELRINGMKKFNQMVSLNDWNEFLKKNEKWVLKEKNEKYCVIECDMDTAFHNVMQGFGIYEEHTDYNTVLE